MGHCVARPLREAVLDADAKPFLGVQERLGERVVQDLERRYLRAIPELEGSEVGNPRFSEIIGSIGCLNKKNKK